MSTQTLQPTQGSTEKGGWAPDAEGTYRSGDLVIALEADDPTRWYVTDVTSGERIAGGQVLCAHRPPYAPALAALDQDLHELGTDGLEEWCQDAEREAEAWYEQEETEQRRKAEEAKRQALDLEARIGEVRADAEALEESAAAGTFASRFTSTQRDLVALMDSDLAPPPALSGSGGVILEGVRHLWPMERKGGKSIATLVMAVDVVLAGGRVVILDRENGERRYALRLKDIARARKLTAEQIAQLREGLTYYAYPQIRSGDAEDLIREMADASLVVFDSSREFMSSQRLKENDSDDYATFMGTAVSPLHRAGIATLILDNAGWSDKGRPRGSSSKEDLNEQLLTAEKTEDFDRETTGSILLEVKESRDGVTGAWTMRIGGNVYGSWEDAPEGAQVGKKGRGTKKKDEKAGRLERMRVVLSEDPGISDMGLASELEVSERTVRDYRKELEASS